MDELHDVLRPRRQVPEPAESLDQIEQALHRFFVAAEREVLGRELSRFDQDVPPIELDGERYRRVLRCETTYTSAAGPVRVEGSLYRPPSGGRAIMSIYLKILSGYRPMAGDVVGRGVFSAGSGFSSRHVYGVDGEFYQTTWAYRFSPGDSGRVWAVAKMGEVMEVSPISGDTTGRCVHGG
jgi:hypothetical protein